MLNIYDYVWDACLHEQETQRSEFIKTAIMMFGL